MKSFIYLFVCFIFILISCIFLYSCENKITPTPCQNGTYSTMSQDSCTACPEGYYCPTSQMTCPKPCTSGMYSNKTSAVACTLCEPGYKCPNASQTPILCNTGSFSIAGSVICTDCPMGHRYATSNYYICFLNFCSSKKK